MGGSKGGMVTEGRKEGSMWGMAGGKNEGWKKERREELRKGRRELGESIKKGRKMEIIWKKSKFGGCIVKIKLE